MWSFDKSCDDFANSLYPPPCNSVNFPSFPADRNVKLSFRMEADISSLRPCAKFANSGRTIPDIIPPPDNRISHRLTDRTIKIRILIAPSIRWTQLCSINGWTLSLFLSLSHSLTHSLAPSFSFRSFVHRVSSDKTWLKILKLGA